jgi:hypothetical protein
MIVRNNIPKHWQIKKLGKFVTSLIIYENLLIPQKDNKEFLEKLKMNFILIMGLLVKLVGLMII